ncbi:MAG TPA: 4Fe-4S binding protein [Dehalococcoidales bacterium]|nr:4Fe-4S binding protein [Dehalococcoidales bacterium]
MAKKPEELTWKDLSIGVVVTEAGNADQYKTGDWRSQRPIMDLGKCTKCGLCYVYCPEGCMEENEEGYFEPNYFYCKGCGICAAECPRTVITMVEEKEE